MATSSSEKSDSSDRPVYVFSRGLWNWLAKPRPRFDFLTTIFGFLATVGLFPFIWHLANKTDGYVELYCPESIRSHEYSVFGRFTGEDYQVRVYIGPDDGTFRYWLQTPPLHYPTRGQWSLKARFGNPYGWDHVKEPPLEYEVLAALVPVSKLRALPGSDGHLFQLSLGEDLTDKLKKSGTINVQRCTIRRDPEHCQYLPHMIMPMASASPRELPDVESPVKIAWEPNLPMYVELWRGGDRITSLSHREWPNNQSFILDPGIYELHVRYKKESDCNASSWFRVVLPETSSGQR